MSALIGRRQYGRLAHGERTRDLLLVNFVRCGVCSARCGITFGNRGIRYYVCARRRHRHEYPEGCAGPYVRTDATDATATRDVLSRIGELRAALVAPVRGRAPSPRVDIGAQRSRAEAKLARAVALAVDGTITAAELATQRARIDVELDAIRRREEEARAEERARDPAARLTIAGALRDLARTWEHLTAEERREAVRTLSAGAVVDGEGALRWTWRTLEEMTAGAGEDDAPA